MPGIGGFVELGRKTSVLGGYEVAVLGRGPAGLMVAAAAPAAVAGRS